MSKTITLLYHVPTSGPAFPLRQTYDLTYDKNNHPRIRPSSELGSLQGYKDVFKEFEDWSSGTVRLYKNEYMDLNGVFIFRPASTLECSLSCEYKAKKIRAFKGDIILYYNGIWRGNYRFDANTFFEVGGSSYTDAEAYKNVKTGGYYGANPKIVFRLDAKSQRCLTEYTKKWRLAKPDEAYAFYNFFKKPFPIKKFEKRKSEIASLTSTSTTEIEGLPRIEIINAKKDPDFLDDLLQSKLNKKHKSFIYFK